MAVSYKKLWKLLIDKDMKKKELCAKAGISPSSLTKMGKKNFTRSGLSASVSPATKPLSSKTGCLRDGNVRE